MGRRHGDGEHPVLLPAQLDVVPGRRRTRPGRRAAAVRRGLRAVGRAPRECTAPPRRQRREPRQLRRRGRLQRRPDLATRTDGALFVGPTNNNRLWSRFTAERESGTPEVLPVYDGGATVRFADVPTDWTAPGDWPGPRIGYLQHANDPITWWDWSLALNRPDWLEEAARPRRLHARPVDPGGHDAPARRRPAGRQRRTCRPGTPVRPGAGARLGGDPSPARMDRRGHRAAGGDSARAADAGIAVYPRAVHPYARRRPSGTVRRFGDVT